MTSRVSFLKLVKETLRRHIAALLITVLVFVVHIIAFFLNVQNELNTQYIEEVKNVVSSAYNPLSRYAEAIAELSLPNFTNALIALFIGAYLAFDFFRYMHSKKETDFYDSLPVKKEKWFATIFTCCFGIFLVCSILTTGIELALIYGVGFGSTLIVKNMLWNLLCMVGIFFAGWVTMALCMIMTGHSIVAFLGVGIMSSYVPLILYYLVPVYASKFFDTYVENTNNTIQYYFSPATLAYKATKSWRTWNIAEHWTYILGCFVFAIVLGIIAYLLFLRRHSETAGRAMAFEKINFVIRFLLVIPLALYVGFFLSEIASFASTAWLIFGIIFAAFLLHGIIECIFQFDIKALISKKRQLLVSIILCFGFAFIFWADVFRYDAYLPDADDVESVKIDTYLLNPNWNKIGDWANGLTGEYVDDALLVVKDIMKSADTSSHTEKYDFMDDFTVTYQLKNGATRTRRYSYYGNSLPESLGKLYETVEFKDDYCVFYHLDKIDITQIGVNNGPENFALDLYNEEHKKLFDIYLEEYAKLSLDELLNEPAICEIVVFYTPKNSKKTVRSSYEVYPSFTNTLDFLKEQGFVCFNDSENVKLINLEIYGEKNDENYDTPRYISDEEQLKKLQKHMIISNFVNENFDEEYVYCDLRYEYNNSTNYISVLIKQSEIDKVLNE